MNVLFEPLRFTKNVEDRKNLEKRRVRLYPQISSYYICSTKHLHNNGEDRNNLKKQSVRLYPQISPFYKGIKEIWG